MDINNYIASGILESYALGLCSKEEAAEVEKLCKESEQLSLELATVQATLNSYGELYSAEPKQKTKDAVFAAIMALEQAQPSELNQNKFPPSSGKISQPGTLINMGSAKTENNLRAPIIPLQKAPLPRYYLMAAIALCVMSLLGNLLLYSKWQNTETALVALNTERSILAANLQSNQVKLDRFSNDMAVMTNPATQKIMLKGIEAHPGMLAAVYWNKESKAVFLEIKKLPMPAAGKQYQLWAMVDGKPMDAGMITMSADSALHQMKDFSAAQAFAITLEKEGGSPTPDLTQLYVIGSIGS